jgi:hypothetical protein
VKPFTWLDLLQGTCIAVATVERDRFDDGEQHAIYFKGSLLPNPPRHAGARTISYRLP